MARAALGYLEAGCWSIIFVCTGAVSALVFFLILGATADIDEDPGLVTKASFDAPVAVTRWGECEALDTSACDALYGSISGALDSAKMQSLMQFPCEPDSPDWIGAQLSTWWNMRCGKVITGEVFSDCMANGAGDFAARFLCEQEAARAETACLGLGATGETTFLGIPSAEDFSSASQCDLAAANGLITTASQAVRCGGDAQLTLETFQYMQGGEYLTNSRCSAVTFAAMVNKGAESKYCDDANSLNYDPPSNPSVVGEGTADAAVCITARSCPIDALNSMLGDAYLHSSSVPSGADIPAGQTVDLDCEPGYSANSALSAKAYCSLAPALDENLQPITDSTGAVVGAWIIDHQCSAAVCPDTGGSDLAANICEGTGDHACATGAFECNGLVYQETCDNVVCRRGYEVSTTVDAEGNASPDVFTCAMDDTAPAGVSFNAGPQASCGAQACYIARFDGIESGEAGDPNLFTSKVTDQEMTFTCTDSTHIAAGVMKCMATHTPMVGSDYVHGLIQGGSCTTNACSSHTSPNIVVVPGLLETDVAAGASSADGLAVYAFDNDPATYWMSQHISQPLSTADPDWLELYVPNGVRPCGYSLQLGRQAPSGVGWDATLEKPTAWTLNAMTGSTSSFLNIDDASNTIASESSVAIDTTWNPPCTSVSPHPSEWSVETDSCGPTSFALSSQLASSDPAFTHFKITFTADEGNAARKQVLVQDFHLKEAFADIVLSGAPVSAQKDAADGTMLMCSGGSPASGPTSLKTCIDAAETAGAAGVMWDGTACTTGVSSVSTPFTGSSTDAVCYL